MPSSSSSASKDSGLESMEELLSIFRPGNIFIHNDADKDTIHAVFDHGLTNQHAAAATAARPTSVVGPTLGPILADKDNNTHLKNTRGKGKSSDGSAGHKDGEKFKPFKDNDPVQNNSTRLVPETILQEKIVPPVLPSRLFEIKPLPSDIFIGEYKEEGLFATQSIPANTFILLEAPLLNGGPTWIGREAALNFLNASKLAAVGNLISDCRCETEPCMELTTMKIWKFNEFSADLNLPMKSDEGEEQVESFIYAHGSKLNHACISNCSMAFTKENYISIRTTRNILQGEELTINYGCEGTFQSRKEKLAKKFKFICRCDTCVNKLYVPPRLHIAYIQHIRELEYQSDLPSTRVLGIETYLEAKQSQEIREWAAKINKRAIDEEEQLLNLYRSLLHRKVKRLIDSEYYTPEPVKSWFKNRFMKYLRDDNRYGLNEEVLQCYLYGIVHAFTANVEIILPGFLDE